MMHILAGLEPAAVFEQFEAICAIPHGSGDTKRISDFCVRFAWERGLRCLQDAQNNVIIWKDASPGYEGHPTVIVQGHLDMVCEKEAGCAIDFSRDGLRLRVDGDWISAQGTTLGGDDGIAVAYALALLDAKELPHPPLEIVLTVDEEIGMLGAAALDLSMLKGRLLFNIDSEEEGILTVSCAGGATSKICLPFTRQSAAGAVYTMTVDGLRGGHSGVEIHKGLCNANKLLAALLDKLPQIQLLHLEGGQKDNAIPRTAMARFLCADKAALYAAAEEAKQAMLARYQAIEPNLSITLEEASVQDVSVLSAASSEKIVHLLQALPNGVQAMSQEIPGLVQTSLNLGIVDTCEDALTITLSVRSSVNTEKEELIGKLKDLAARFGACYTQSGEYPAWEYRKDSKLRPLMAATFEKLYGKAPVIEAVHAGLECGVLADKLPGLDAVSFGPRMQGIHTTRERLSISSARRTWEYLCAVLAQI